MRELTGEQTLMRIFIGESDRWEGRPLYQVIIELLRREHIAGATVVRGISGFGARSVLHTANLLRLSTDLPMVIEAVDSRENVDRILSLLDPMIGDGLVTLEKVQVLRYSPGKV
jgi:uncharacterized protein